MTTDTNYRHTKISKSYLWCEWASTVAELKFDDSITACLKCSECKKTIKLLNTYA